MKIYLILGLLLVCGITFLPLTGDAQKDKGAIRGEREGPPAPMAISPVDQAG